MDAIEPDNPEVLDAEPQDAELAEELRRMGAEDHASAHLANSADIAEQLDWRRLATRHGDRLAELLEAHGWPTEARVGADAARAAWLIAQHADRQLEVQRLALRLLEEAVEQGEPGLDRLAFLLDRTRVNEGRAQLYGTQIAGVQDGVPVPWPCEDPEQLDALRAEVGIEPFAEYTARFSAGR